MTKIQLGSGSSSSATHHTTQPSSTLNRRYVGRPTNLIVEEAAQRAASVGADSSTSAPSRLVNLRLHAADIEQAAQLPPAEPEAPVSPDPVIPRVVELGNVDHLTAADLSQIVPAEAAIDDPYYNEPFSLAALPANSSMDVALTAQPEYDNYNNMPTVSVTETTMVTAPMSEVDAEALAMNIAADYAAASMGALNVGAPVDSMNIAPVSNNSIDSVAQAASEAIAAIRMATDPDEIAAQIASLQSFADNIKANSAAPEMIELSETIEKFISVAMKSSKVQSEVEQKTSSAPAEKPKASSKPSVKKTTASRSAAKTTSLVIPAARPIATRARARAAAARPTMKRASSRKATSALVADEDQALRKALHSVAAMDNEPATKPAHRRPVAKKTSGKRFVVAFLCAAACVAAIVYFIGSSIPDISVKVAAMQTGIEASYPSYVPRDYSLSDISSEEGKITLTFKGPDKASFILSEEKSSWDSTTLLRNFVEPTWHDAYITTHEQGVTIYIAGANAAWVNGGVLYKIETSGNSLTNKQLRNIVTSL